MRPSLLRWIGCGAITIALVAGFMLYFQIPRNAAWLFACFIFPGLWLESVLARSLWDLAEWYAVVATITVVGAITANPCVPCAHFLFAAPAGVLAFWLVQAPRLILGKAPARLARPSLPIAADYLT
jgi:hypothetical protein